MEKESCIWRQHRNDENIPEYIPYPGIYETYCWLTNEVWHNFNCFQYGTWPSVCLYYTDWRMGLTFLTFRNTRNCFRHNGSRLMIVGHIIPHKHKNVSGLKVWLIVFRVTKRHRKRWMYYDYVRMFFLYQAARPSLAYENKIRLH